MGWAAKSAMHNFWLPDSAGFLITTLVIYCAFARHDRWFLVLLMVGVAVREVVFFAAPLYYTLHTRKVLDLNLLRRSILLSLPALMVIVGLRLAIPAWNDVPEYTSKLPRTLRQVQANEASYNYFDLLREVPKRRLQNLSWVWLGRYTIGAWGPAATVLPLLSRRNGALALRLLPFLVLIYAQLLVATDTERLLAVGFPAVILLSLNGVRALEERFGLPTLAIGTLLLASYALNLAQPRASSASLGSQVAVLVVFIYMYICLRPDPAPSREDSLDYSVDQ